MIFILKFLLLSKQIQTCQSPVMRCHACSCFPQAKRFPRGVQNTGPGPGTFKTWSVCHNGFHHVFNKVWFGDLVFHPYRVEVNPSTPRSDKHVTSPYSIYKVYNIQQTGNENSQIFKWKLLSWSNTQLSLFFYMEMCSS